MLHGGRRKVIILEYIIEFKFRFESNYFTRVNYNLFNVLLISLSFNLFLFLKYKLNNRIIKALQKNQLLTRLALGLGSFSLA